MHLLLLKLRERFGLKWQTRCIFGQFINILAINPKASFTVINSAIYRAIFKKEALLLKQRLKDAVYADEFNRVLEIQYNKMISEEASNESIQANHKDLYEFVKNNIGLYDSTPVEMTRNKSASAKKSILYFCDYLLDDQFNLSWIQCHDTSKFEVVVFQNNEIDDKYKKLGVKIINDYEDLKKQSFDYVIDCNGYFNFHRSLYALGKRIGRFQISAFNDLLPISSPHIDYVMSYDYLLYGFDEKKFVALPDKSIIALMPLPKTKLPLKLPCESNKYITFGSAASPVKINRTTIELWSAVLLQSKGSKIKLIHPLYESDVHTKRILDLFSEFKIGKSRVVFSKIGSYPWYLKEFAGVDIHVAAYPIAGGRVLTQSLSEGYFSVNLEKKDNVFSRCAGMFASALGIEEFNTHDPEQFKKICLDLAANPQKIKEMRIQVRNRIIAFNNDYPDYFTKEVEQKLLALG